jgi:hypothetical protein
MVNTKQIREATVFYEGDNEARWVDAIGSNVVKFELQRGFPTDDTTGDPTQFDNNITEAGAGDTTCVNAATAGEVMYITTAGNEYDGTNIQLKGEAFKLEAGLPMYFGIKCALDSATQSDFLVGVGEKLAAVLKVAAAHGFAAANVEGVFFSKLDAGTTLTAQSWKNGTVSAAANCATAFDVSAHIYEIYWDGYTVYFYFDGTLVTSTAATLADGDLTPTVQINNGEASVMHLEVYWMRCIQIR